MNKERVQNALIIENILSNTEKELTINLLELKGFTNDEASSIMKLLKDFNLISPDLIKSISEKLSIPLSNIYDFSNKSMTFRNFIRRYIKENNPYEQEDIISKRDLTEYEHGKFIAYASIIKVLMYTTTSLKLNTFINTLLKEVNKANAEFVDEYDGTSSLKFAGCISAYNNIIELLESFIK